MESRRFVLVTLALLAPASLGAEVEKKGEEPAPAQRAVAGLNGVRAIDVDVEFSRVFRPAVRSRRLVRPGPRRVGPGGERDRLEEAAEEFRKSKAAEDPLKLACRISCEFTSANRWRAVVTGVRASFDDPDIPGWTLAGADRKAREAAAELLVRLSAVWRFAQTSSEQRAILDAQLVAASLVLLQGSDLAPSFDPEERTVSLPGLRDLLEESLPEAFPLAVFREVEWFLGVALDRIVAPGPVALDPSGEFVVHGVRYRAQKTQRRGKELRALIVGRLHDADIGLAVEESAAIDARTGWLVESRGLVVHAPALGETTRFGAQRWHLTRRSVEVLAAPDEKAPGRD